MAHTLPKIKRMKTSEGEFQCSSCATIKESLQKEMSDFKEMMTNQNKAVMEVLGAQTVLIKTLVRQQADTNTVKCTFPICNEEQLQEVDKKICDENKASYIQAMKSLIRGSSKKQLISILAEDVIMDFNIDGTHGKKRLKDFNSFYSVLKDAFSTENCTDSENVIRKAFQNIKKQHFHTQCLKKKALNNAQEK